MDKARLKTWFGDNVEANMDSLYAVALRLTRNPADAEDLLGESVAKAWVVVETLTDLSRFRAWMFRILHNCFVSEYRKKAVRPNETSYDEAPTNDEHGEIASLLIKQSDEFLYWWGNPEREFTNKLLGRDIMRAIDELPEAFRLTILLINVEGLGYDEAADVLGVPTGTVRSRMKRGRTLLQKALWEHAKDAGLVAGTCPTE